MSVNHEQNTFLHGNTLITVNPGQTVTSLRKLGDRWGWGQEKVRRFLNLLVSDAMIKIECDTKKTLVTVENWAFYQSDDGKARHRRDTGETLTVTNNNDNNENKDSLSEESLSPASYRSRYTSEQLKLVDEFFGILKHTRISAKIADSVVLRIYEEWDKHDPKKVIYALHKYVHSPSLHDKKESYVLGIIRNATAEEIGKYREHLRGDEENKPPRPRKSRIVRGEDGTEYTEFEEDIDND